MWTGESGKDASTHQNICGGNTDMNSHLLPILLIMESNYSHKLLSTFSLFPFQGSTGRLRKPKVTVRRVWQRKNKTQLFNSVRLISIAVVLSIYVRGVYSWSQRHTYSLHWPEILNGSSLSAGANQSAGGSIPPPPTPPAAMTTAATDWEWTRRYCMMRLICSLQGN